MSKIDLTQFEGHTPGPWRWEYNAEHRSVHVVGGRPLHDLTVMDFARWGMGGATPVFRDVAEDGMNIMHKLNSRPDWVAPFKGRQHHAGWCSAVIHPDACLMAEAPVLLAEVKRQAAEIKLLKAALIPLANAAAPIERELLTDADIERAQAALYGEMNSEGGVA